VSQDPQLQDPLGHVQNVYSYGGGST